MIQYLHSPPALSWNGLRYIRSTKRVGHEAGNSRFTTYAAVTTNEQPAKHQANTHIATLLAPPPNFYFLRDMEAAVILSLRVL